MEHGAVPHLVSSDGAFMPARYADHSGSSCCGATGAYRTCFGLLSLKDKYTAARLERACGRALTQSEAPTYSHVKRILERSEDLQQDDPKHEAKTQPRGYRRGADYYKQEMQGREGNEDAVQ